MPDRDRLERLLPDPSYFNRRFKAQERREREMRAAKRLGSSSIDARGTLSLTGPDGQTLATFGKVPDPVFGPGASGVVFYDGASGLPKLEAFDPGTGQPSIVAMRDAAGHRVVADDIVSGEGLAFPLLPTTLVPTDPALWPSTTSSEFLAQLRGGIVKQQPRLYVGVLASVQAGTTGEARLVLNGTPAGEVVPVAEGASTLIFGPVAVPGEHLAIVDVAVEARRLTGTGSLAFAHYFTTGLAS